MPKYLYQRSDGRSRNWHVRIVAPTDVYSLLPASERELRRSTGTADRKKATLVAARFVAECHQKWDKLRNSLQDSSLPDISIQTIALSTNLIDQICGARLASWAMTDDSQRYEEGGLDEQELEEIQEFCAYTDAEMRSILARGMKAASWGSVVEGILDWCYQLEYEINPVDPLFPQLVRRYAEVEKRAAQIISQRNEGEAVEFPVCSVPQPLLSSVAPLYTSHKGRTVSRKVYTTNISIWERFMAYRGDVALDAISSGDIYRFLESRLKCDTKPWSEGYTLGRAKNVLKEFFALARTMDLMKSPNPVLGLETNPRLTAEESEATKKPRFPFNDVQLNTIFSSYWYIPNSEQFRGSLKTDLGMRYWGPLISIFHGLRVRELVQLHSHDFVSTDGCMLMTIQLDLTDTESEDRPARVLKNNATKRTIPVHPKLIELGFRQFVETAKQRHSGGVPLFPSAVPQEKSKSPLWGRAYEQAFLRCVRDKLGFGNGFGNHSFRHAVEDKVRDAQLINGIWPAGLSQFYTGRTLPRDADRDVVRMEGSEAGYGRGFTPQKMLSFVNQIAFDNVRLPLPFCQWKELL